MAKDLKVNWFHFCEYASLSRENKFSISGIFDELKVSNVPASFPRFFIVSVLEGDPNSRHSVMLRVIDPKGKKTLVLGGPPLKLGDNGKSNFVVDLSNMPVLEIGDYKVELLEGEKVLIQEKLPVIKTNLNSNEVKNS